MRYTISSESLLLRSIALKTRSSPTGIGLLRFLTAIRNAPTDSSVRIICADADILLKSYAQEPYTGKFRPWIFLCLSLSFSTTYCNQTNIRKRYPYKQFQPLISDTHLIFQATPGMVYLLCSIFSDNLYFFVSNSHFLKRLIFSAHRRHLAGVLLAWNCDGAPGIVYTTDWAGKPVVYDRMHWTLAEAINTSAVLFRISGDEKTGIKGTVIFHQNPIPEDCRSAERPRDPKIPHRCAAH